MTAPAETAPERTALDSIARLPEQARAEVSRALADGKTWRAVAEICQRHGCKGVTPQNVTNYRQGAAHKAWLARQERIAAIQGEQAESREIFEAGVACGMNPAEAACFVSSRKILGMFQGMDLGAIEAAAADDPRLLIELMRAAVALAGELRKVKGRDESADAPRPGGVSKEEQARLVREFFGIAS